MLRDTNFRSWFIWIFHLGDGLLVSPCATISGEDSGNEMAKEKPFMVKPFKTIPLFGCVLLMAYLAYSCHWDLFEQKTDGLCIIFHFPHTAKYNCCLLFCPKFLWDFYGMLFINPLTHLLPQVSIDNTGLTFCHYQQAVCPPQTPHQPPFQQLSALFWALVVCLLACLIFTAGISPTAELTGCW